MQIALNLAIILIAFLLQNTLGIYFKLGTVTPDIVLIAVLSIALIGDQVSGISSGFFGGLLKDLVSMRGFGINALTYTLIGYFAGALEATVIRSSLILMAAVAIATFVGHFLYVGIAFLVSYQIDYLFWKSAFLAAFYNALISPFIYLLINAFYSKMTSKTSGIEMIKDGQKKA